MCLSFNFAEVKENCNPYVDIVFVLDDSYNITKTDLNLQTTFVQEILKDHRAPRGAVKVAIMTCGNNFTSSGAFTDNMETTKDDLTQRNAVFTKDKTRHCLENLDLKFKSESRDGVSKMAVVLKGYWDWDVEEANAYASAIKNDKTTVVVVAIGVQNFDGLSALRSIATGDSTYFVLAKFENLHALAQVLTKGSCMRKYIFNKY